MVKITPQEVNDVDSKERLADFVAALVRDLRENAGIGKTLALIDSLALWNLGLERWTGTTRTWVSRF